MRWALPAAVGVASGSLFYGGFSNHFSVGMAVGALLVAFIATFAELVFK